MTGALIDFDQTMVGAHDGNRWRKTRVQARRLGNGCGICAASRSKLRGRSRAKPRFPEP
jgi:uncharacterized protein YwlG (UPF0340 family)